jgi:hypothetical protein
MSANDEEVCASSGKKAGRTSVLANSGSADRIPSVEMIMIAL